MRRCRVLAVLAGAVAVGGAVGLAAAGTTSAGAVRPAGAVPASGSWGTAIEVPGLAALNMTGEARVTSVSCASAGNCAAGGHYRDRRRHLQGFVAVERHGHWGKAIGVPGLAALNTGRYAEVTSVSCASAGSCAAGGYYNADQPNRGFVVVERHGRWGKAIEVPGLAALNTGGFAHVNSVSCGSAGNCAAGGDYEDHFNTLGFLVVERDGRWGNAIKVPGLGALNTGGDATVSSVSCGSAGNCAADGTYVARGHSQGFAADERDGVWGNAIEMPGLAALDKGQYGAVRSVSCPPAGTCAAGGTYTRLGHFRGFVT